MTNPAIDPAFGRMTDVELNEAFARVARAHPGEWDHPRRVAIRAEMVRRTGAAGMTQTLPLIPSAADIAALTCPYCPRPFDLPDHVDHLRAAHPDEVRAHHERIARAGRRRRAAERGQDWTEVQ